MAPRLVRRAGQVSIAFGGWGLRSERAYAVTAVLVSELTWVAMIVASLQVNIVPPFVKPLCAQLKLTVPGPVKWWVSCSGTAVWLTPTDALFSKESSAASVSWAPPVVNEGTVDEQLRDGAGGFGDTGSRGSRGASPAFVLAQDFAAGAFAWLRASGASSLSIRVW